MSRNRLVHIDCSRALCMLWIIGFWHLVNYTSYLIDNKFAETVTYGVLSAFTFFSGFFLGRKRIATKSDVIDFYRKRFLRLYPLFFLSASSFFLLNIFFGVQSIESFQQYCLTLFGLSILVPPSPGTIWYVCMLFVFYAWTPLFLSRRNVYQKILIIVLSVFSLFCICYFGRADSRMLILFPFYVLGMVTPENLVKAKKVHPSVLLAALLCLTMMSALSVFMYRYISILICSFLIVVISIESGKILGKSAIISNLMSFISYGSMCAYLFHRQIYGVFHTVIGDFPLLFAIGVALPIVICISFYLQKAYNALLKLFIR